MPFQIEHAGVNALPDGRIAEYIVYADGMTIEFDNFIERGDPPTPVFQEFKGDYSILEMPWMKPDRRAEIVNGMVRQAERQIAGTPNALHEYFFKNESVADLFFDALIARGIDLDTVRVHVVEPG